MNLKRESRATPLVLRHSATGSVSSPPLEELPSMMEMEGKPLPKLPPRLHNSPSIFGAYPQILNLERNEHAAYNRDPSADRVKRLIYARILGYLILEGPSDQARVAVALEVNGCNGEKEKLLDIGQFYFEHYIRAFRTNKGRTPVPSDYVSPPSFDSRKAMIIAMVVEAPQNHQQAKANALVRDGFRCVISGLYDTTSVLHNKELVLEVKEAAVAVVCASNCAHIFPEPTDASSVWAVLERFGYKMAYKELNGNGIHRLENILTVNHDVRTSFDALQLWLEPVETDIPNTYKLCAAHEFFIDPRWKSTVTFTTPDPVKLPVPSPSYLELHAACCRVANLSGGWLILSREMDDIQVLSQDGTSAEALQYAL